MKVAFRVLIVATTFSLGGDGDIVSGLPEIGNSLIEVCPKTSDVRNGSSIGTIVLQEGGVSWEIVEDGAPLGKVSLSTLTFVSTRVSAG